MILPTTQKDVDREDPSPGALRNAQVIEIDDDDDSVHKDDDLGEKGVKNLAGGVTEEEMEEEKLNSEDSNALDKVGALGDEAEQPSPAPRLEVRVSIDGRRRRREHAEREGCAVRGDAVPTRSDHPSS